MDLNPLEDGTTHINIYSKGKTLLGRFLSNFSYAPFNNGTDGSFYSIEGYWYWLSTKDDKLRTLIGYDAKSYGQAICGKDWPIDEEFKTKIKTAIERKIFYNHEMYNNFIDSKLPFSHYYVYGSKVVEPKEGKWIIDFIEQLRKDWQWKV